MPDSRKKLAGPSAAYKEKLRDPRWQRKRLEQMQIANFCCERCGDSETELHVHHRRYIPGREPWEYADHDFEVLCRNCHHREHEAEEVIAEKPVWPPTPESRKKQRELLFSLYGREWKRLLEQIHNAMEDDQ